MLQLHKTRLQIEKYAYDKGTNVALYFAEQEPTYKKFQKSVEKGILSQIKFIAEYKETLPFLLSLAKASVGPLGDQIGVLLATKRLSNDVNLAAYLVWAGTQGGQATIDKLGLTGIFGLTNQKLVDYFNEYSNLIIDGIDDTTKKWIAAKIQEGKDKGLTPFEIQRSLIDDGKAISAIRAERIVLTETARAMTVVEHEAAKRYGIKSRIWRTSRDDRVDPICVDLEGKEAPYGKMFPGGYDGPPAHVSCRCFEEEVIPEGWEIPSKIWLGE